MVWEFGFFSVLCRTLQGSSKKGAVNGVLPANLSTSVIPSLSLSFEMQGLGWGVKKATAANPVVADILCSFTYSNTL